LRESQFSRNVGQNLNRSTHQDGLLWTFNRFSFA
jgi:hypothetical protein